jgi:DNA polymerase III alpha subunit (gram-positive type)
VAYRAEIEISVKGARQLREVTGQIEQLAERVDLVSANFKPFIQTLAQFESNLSTAATTLRRVRAGTDDEVTAIKQYVQALGEANTARARQNNLIQQELALQEAAKRKTEPSSTGFSRAQYGPALPPAFIKQQEDQQNFKRLFADLNETAKVISVSNTNTKTSWRKAFEELNETAKAISVNRLNTQTSWQRTFKELNETAKAISVNRLNTQTSWQKAFEELNETAKAISVNRLNTQTSWQKAFKELNETAKAISVNRLNTQTSWQRTFKELNETAKAISVSRLNVKSSWIKALSDLEEVATDISKAAERERRETRNRARRGTVAAGRRRQQRTRDATSNAIIGGAFPLLFGQGAGAAVGGAAGGALGGLAGGQFGFGLSLVGTAVGTAVDTLIAETVELAKALNSTGGAFDLLTEKNLFSSKETELLANQLAELGEVEKLATLVTEELVGIIGNN